MDNQKPISNELLMKSLIDGLHRIHLEKDRERHMINVGEATKNQDYNDLYIYIRYGRGDAPARLAKIRNGNYAIVIDSDKEDDVSTFLSRNDVFSQIDSVLEQYKKHSGKVESSDGDDDIYDLESNYRKLVSILNADVLDVKSKIEDLAKQKDDVADAFKRTSLSMAIKMIVEEEFGNGEDAFVKKVLKREESRFVTVMDKHEKEVLISRLKSYYRNKIQPLLK